MVVVERAEDFAVVQRLIDQVGERNPPPGLLVDVELMALSAAGDDTCAPLIADGADCYSLCRRGAGSGTRAALPTYAWRHPNCGRTSGSPHRHHEAHRLTAKLRYPRRYLRRGHRAFQAIVHLKQRNDAFAPAGPHRQLRVTRGRAWMRAFIALRVSARCSCLRYQGCSGSLTRRLASSRRHGPKPFCQRPPGAQTLKCRRAPS